MKIVHCLNQYMPMIMAGTEVYAHTLASLQQSLGHEVAVVMPHIDYYARGQIQAHYIFEEINVYQYLETGNPDDRQVHYGNKKPEGLENFRQLINSLQPSVIHFHELNRSIGLTTEHVKIAKESGAKVVITMHLSSYTCNTNILINNNHLCEGNIDPVICGVCTYKTMFGLPGIVAGPLAVVGSLSAKAGLTGKKMEGKLTTLLQVPKSIGRIRRELQELAVNVDQVVSYAKWYKAILLRNGVPENKITVVPPALVTTKKPDGQKNNAPVKLPVKMVFIGRIQETKGIHLIISAMRKFSGRQVQIDLYGKEEDTPYYQQCVKDSADIETITWKGVLKRDEVIDRLRQYDIFCLASTFSEMSPLVIQESFAAGIPVLASKVYGNMEHITHRHNGLLFEYNDAKSLQEQITVLINDPKLIQEMKSNVKAPVDFGVVTKAYLDLYASL